MTVPLWALLLVLVLLAVLYGWGKLADRDDHTWQCEDCGRLNSERALTCVDCGTVKP